MRIEKNETMRMALCIVIVRECMCELRAQKNEKWNMHKGAHWLSDNRATVVMKKQKVK